MAKAGDGFKYEKCLLKHYVRVHGWLPKCKERRQKANKGLPRNRWRRLRYFTFCAIGAVDVLMLDIAKVVVPSGDSFDTVVFFDRNSDAVMETQRRIPGATGFIGSFTSVVLANDGEPDDSDAPNILASPEEAEDVAETHKAERIDDQHRKFFLEFPFDIINLDLEEFAFKPNDKFPGNVVKALQKIALWQQRPMQGPRGKPAPIDGFTLMFTTRIGPPKMSADYVDMLRAYLNENVKRQPSLLALLNDRLGVASIEQLETEHFADFFKIGIRKVLASILLEKDWYVDPADGIKTFEFERTVEEGSYTMLHFVMDVTRQSPPHDNRAPNTQTDEATDAYTSIVELLFSKSEIMVTDALVKDKVLKPSLDDIDARRRKYYTEPA